PIRTTGMPLCGRRHGSTHPQNKNATAGNIPRGASSSLPEYSRLMKFFFLGAALLCSASALPAVTSVTDGTFFNWSFSSVGAGSMTVDGANGNPASGLNVTTTTAFTSDFVYGIGVDLNFSTAEALSGIFSLGLDVKSGAGDFGSGQAVSLIVKQGSDLYSEILGTTNYPHTNFDTLTF